MTLAVENVPDVVLWAPVASAGLLMVAALAAWRTAAVTGRAFRRSILPDLDVTFLVPKPRGPVQVTVRNVGAGVAKVPNVVLVVKDAAMHQYIAGGILHPGKGVKITTQIPAQTLVKEDHLAVAGCRDVNNVHHGWSSHWEHREFRTRWLRRPVETLDWGEAFQTFYPGVDPTGRQPLPYVIEALTD